MALAKGKKNTGGVAAGSYGKKQPPKTGGVAPPTSARKKERQNKLKRSLKMKNQAEARRRKALKKRLDDTPKKITKGGVEGVASPTVAPFMTAEDMMNQGNAESQYDNTLADTDYELEQQRISTEENKRNLEQTRIKGISGAENNLASRGLQRSGVRDSQLWDIDATAALGRSDLDTRLNMATMAAERTKSNALNAWTKFQHAMGQRQVENANELSEDNGPWQVDPVAGQEVVNPAYEALKKKIAAAQGKQSVKPNKANDQSNPQKKQPALKRTFFPPQPPPAPAPPGQPGYPNQKKKKK